MGKRERAQPTRQNRKPANGLGRTESSAPTPLCLPSPWGEGAERSEADEGAIFRKVISRRPLIRHGAMGRATFSPRRRR